MLTPPYSERGESRSSFLFLKSHDTKLRLKNKHAQKKFTLHGWTQMVVFGMCPVELANQQFTFRTIAGSPSLTRPIAFDRAPFESKSQNNPN